MSRKIVDNIHSVRDLLYWSYANLAMAHHAVSHNETNYSRVSFMVRSRLYRGLSTNTMSFGSILDDEKIKVRFGDRCAYCGSMDAISIDHVLPRVKYDGDYADNLVRVCNKCNSSKEAKDLVVWFTSKGEFPPLLILRRYLKLVYRYCCDKGLIDLKIEELSKMDLPFSINTIPIDYPSPDRLLLHK